MPIYEYVTCPYCKRRTMVKYCPRDTLSNSYWECISCRKVINTCQMGEMIKDIRPNNFDNENLNISDLLK